MSLPKPNFFYTFLLLAFATATYWHTAQAQTLQVGEMAPDFSLKNQHDQTVTLSQFKGHWIVLYFYPKDETPGCTTEACSFRDNINKLIAQKATILGVSVDSVSSHKEFQTKHKLPFDLLADKEGLVAKQYDSLLDLIVMKFAKRHTFIINPEGRIAKIYTDVDPKEHVQIVLTDLKALQKSH